MNFSVEQDVFLAIIIQISQTSFPFNEKEKEWIKHTLGG
jgi:hypothetical protein